MTNGGDPYLPVVFSWVIPLRISHVAPQIPQSVGARAPRAGGQRVTDSQTTQSPRVEAPKTRKDPERGWLSPF